MCNVQLLGRPLLGWHTKIQNVASGMRAQNEPQFPHALVDSESLLLVVVSSYSVVKALCGSSVEFMPNDSSELTARMKNSPYNGRARGIEKGIPCSGFWLKAQAQQNAPKLIHILHSKTLPSQEEM